MPPWHTTTVANIAPAADELTAFSLDLRGTPLVGSHQLAGQYVRLRLPGLAEAPFAIASAPQPQGTRWDFLLKSGSPLPEALAQLSVGDPVQAAFPEGNGFPLEKALGQNLLLFATGSGISPIRSVIEKVRAERASFGRVKLFFGVRTPSAFAYSSDFATWEEAGISVVQTVSQPGASGWQGLTGYVQAHLGEEPIQDTFVFVCGQKAMVQKVMEALSQRGVPSDRVHLNY